MRATALGGKRSFRLRASAMVRFRSDCAMTLSSGSPLTAISDGEHLAVAHLCRHARGNSEVIPLSAILIVGTGHEAYQIRPRCGPQDGADAFKRHILQTVRTHRCKTIAEENSVEGLRGRCTVGQEVAREEVLKHILCDPTASEREEIGISQDNSDIAKREGEWVRRVIDLGVYPVLFVCGSTHVSSFAQSLTQKPTREQGV
jgi:hypothetical protein